MLQSMGSQRVGHNLVSGQQNNRFSTIRCIYFMQSAEAVESHKKNFENTFEICAESSLKWSDSLMIAL